MATRLRTAITAAGLLLGLAACGQAPQAGDGPTLTPGDGGRLTGTYLSTVATEDGVPRPLVADTRVSVQFTDDGRLLAAAGCNTLSAQVTVTDDRVETTEVATTEMGCDPQRHEQDEWLAGFLGADPEWRLDGETLVLTADQTQVVLGTEQSPPLLETEWVLDTLVTGDTAGSVPAGASASLVFAADTVAIDTGCNTGSTAYRVQGSTIAFEPPVLTRMACPPAIMDLEDALVAVLGDQAEYAIEGKVLTLTSEGEGVRLRAG